MMKIQEAFENITKRTNSIPSPKTSLVGENTNKDVDKGENTLPAAGSHFGCAVALPGRKQLFVVFLPRV